MVLTRGQERMLTRQYQYDVDAKDANLSTPEAVGRHTLADGRLLKSALKTPSLPRSWDPIEDEPPAPPADGTTKKRVRIQSEENVVHVFEKDSSIAAENGNGLGTGMDQDYSSEEYRSGAHEERTTHEGGAVPRGNRPSPRSTRQDSRRPFVPSKAILAILSLLGWAVSSSWLIFLNRDLMRFKGFPFLFMTPAISQLGCAGMAWGCGHMGLVPVRPWSTPEFKRRLLPLVFSSVVCMLLGNAGYFRLSLSFLNILKALTPAVTLGVSAAVGAEAFTPMAFLSTMLIAYGTGAATMQETSNNKAFHWPSFLAFLLSVFFEASRVVMASKLLGGMARPYNPIEMLAHAGPGVAVCMGIGSLLWEAKALVALSLSSWIRLTPDLIMLCMLSFLVNISSYYAIQHTSSTTFKVVGECLLEIFFEGVIWRPFEPLKILRNFLDKGNYIFFSLNVIFINFVFY